MASIRTKRLTFALQILVVATLSWTAGMYLVMGMPWSAALNGFGALGAGFATYMNAISGFVSLSPTQRKP